MTDDNCIFCKIVKGEAPSHKIWEDDNYLAFLSIFPNTEGFSVVITKDHYPSYAFDLPDKVLTGLVLAAKKVGKLLDSKLEDVGRTAMMFEGFGVNHKTGSNLLPMSINISTNMKATFLHITEKEVTMRNCRSWLRRLENEYYEGGQTFARLHILNRRNQSYKSNPIGLLESEIVLESSSNLILSIALTS